MMHAAGDSPHGRRLRGLIVILWRAGLRLHEALARAEADLDQRRGSLLVRHGKGGRRREVGSGWVRWRGRHSASTQIAAIATVVVVGAARQELPGR